MELMSTCTSLPTFVDEDSDNLQYRADYLSSSYMDLQLPNEQITQSKITFKIVFTQILPIRKTIRRTKLLTIGKKDQTVQFRLFGKKYKLQIHKKHCLVNFGLGCSQFDNLYFSMIARFMFQTYYITFNVFFVWLSDLVQRRSLYR